MEDMVEKIQRDLGAHNLDLGYLGGLPWEGGCRVKDWQGPTLSGRDSGFALDSPENFKNYSSYSYPQRTCSKTLKFSCPFEILVPELGLALNPL